MSKIANVKFSMSPEQAMQSDIINRVYDTIDKANELFNIDLDWPSITFNARGRKAGTANSIHHHLDFNMTLAMENPDTFYQTVIHEVAHLVTDKVYPRAKQAHGPEFKRVDKLLGGRGTTYHNYDVSSVKQKRSYTRYEALCLCGTHFLTRNRRDGVKQTTAAYGRSSIYCLLCKNPLTLTGKTAKFEGRPKKFIKN